MDSIKDGLAKGYMVGILSVVDPHTRECLAGNGFKPGWRLCDLVLESLIEERGGLGSVRVFGPTMVGVLFPSYAELLS